MHDTPTRWPAVSRLGGDGGVGSTDHAAPFHSSASVSALVPTAIHALADAYETLLSVGKSWGGRAGARSFTLLIQLLPSWLGPPPSRERRCGLSSAARPGQCTTQVPK